MPLTGREKATIFLSILGAETASRILRYLPDEISDLIASGINHLPTPSSDALSEVINEYQSFLSLPEAYVPPALEKPVRAPRKSYAALMYERPQIAAYVLSLLPEEERADALHSLSREKAVVEELLGGLKSNLLSPKLASILKEVYSGRLF